MKHTRIMVLTFALSAACALASCGKKNTDVEETGQQVGDVMASIDESGGNGGTIASAGSVIGAQRTFARLLPSEMHDAWWKSVLGPSAYAVACGTASEFSSCTNN